MIKVKGQLGEMAKCLEDDDRRVRDLAKLFFSELSTKEKAIYNNLPDIVSSLSAGAGRVDEKTFEAIMQTIFKYIDKVSCGPSLCTQRLTACTGKGSRGDRRQAMSTL
jgi:condensin complex subunit 1